MSMSMSISTASTVRPPLASTSGRFSQCAGRWVRHGQRAWRSDRVERRCSVPVAHRADRPDASDFTCAVYRSMSGSSITAIPTRSSCARPATPLRAPSRRVAADVSSAGVSSTRATRMRRRDRRPLWTNRSLTHSRDKSVQPAPGARPSERHWAPPPHRLSPSSGWPRSRMRATRLGAIAGAAGARSADHWRPGRAVRPTSNAARTKRTGFARCLIPAPPPAQSVAGGTVPRARSTITVASTSPA
jgi:hypothetical protein